VHWNQRYINLLVLGCLLASVFASSGWSQKKKLTFNQVFKRGEPQLLSLLPQIEGWQDEKHYLEWQSAERDQKSPAKLLRVNAVTGERSIYFDEGRHKDKLPEGFSLQKYEDRLDDFSGFIFTHDNDLYYFSSSAGVFQQITATPSPEKNARFSPDGHHVAYTRDNNLYVLELESGLERQLTSDGSETIYNGYASWVYYEEILGRASRYAAFWWSPNSKMIAFLRFDDSPVPTFPLFRADGVHGELEITRYPKAGDPNPYVKLGIYHLDQRKLIWIDLDERADHYVAWPFWTPDSKQLLFQWMNRGQDHLIIYSADPNTGQCKLVYQEHQDSWVEFFEDLYLFKNGSGMLIRSNKDGWSHLYYYDLEGQLKQQLTSGEWNVKDVAHVDEAHNMVYFHGSKENSTENHLYVVGLNGKNLRRLTKPPGRHHCQVSPGGKYFIDRHENISHPAQLDLCSGDGKVIRTLGSAKTPALDEYDLGKVELFTIPSGDGYNLPAIWVLPPNFDPSQQYPVLFHVYGGPAAATVSNFFAPLTWHYYAQHGIIVISVDHRGSGHFGKNGVALMHRNLGKWEMNDLIAAAKWLRNQPFVDPNRIGITGGSYGGYTTCMALTYGADYFTHGIAEYSVIDWRLYDTVYTERYMDSPQENPQGYDFGSVLTHADKYKGHLLITHGTMDDNVHMQNTIQFISKLQDLDRDFELMLYPNARHGVGGQKRNHSMRENVQFWFRHFFGREIELE